MDYMNNPTERDQQIAREAAGRLPEACLPWLKDCERIILAAIQDAKQQGNEEIILKGAECACALTGDPEATVENVEQAWQAINECLRLGQERNDEANALRLQLSQGNEDTARLKAGLEELFKINAELNKLPMGNFYLPETMEGFLEGFAARGVQPAAKEEHRHVFFAQGGLYVCDCGEHFEPAAKDSHNHSVIEKHHGCSEADAYDRELEQS